MDVIDNMLDLTRRLPPNNIEENLAALIELQPDYADDLLGSIDQPLKVRTDTATGRDYLICDYNRDGESYRSAFGIIIRGLHKVLILGMSSVLRSPWSNEYDPPLADGTQPSEKLRKLEIAANEAFDTYREMCVLFPISMSITLLRLSIHVSSILARRYYEGGVSSVFLWEQEDGGFAGVVLLKKSESAVEPSLSLTFRSPRSCCLLLLSFSLDDVKRDFRLLGLDPRL